MKHKVVIFFLFLVYASFVHAQNTTLFNNNDTFFVSPNAQVHVFGNIVTSGNTATMYQHGFVQTYNDGNPGNFELQNLGNVRATGDFKIEQDWINNGRLRIDTGQVEMYGANQFFSGDSISRFCNLLLTGTDIKEQAQDIRVRNILNITDRELAVHQFNLFIDNIAPTAIQFVNTFGVEGIISTDEDGWIRKVVRQNEQNIIPTGSSQGIFRHRPAKIHLLSGAIRDTARITFHHHSPDLANASTQDLDRGLCRVQPAYFYTFNATNVQHRYQLDFASYEPIDDYFPLLVKWNNPSWSIIQNQTPFAAGTNAYTYTRANLETQFIHQHYGFGYDLAKAPSIAGDTFTCNELSEAWTHFPTTANTYEWTVNNADGSAVIQEGQNTDRAIINWHTSNGGYIILRYENEFGCWSKFDTLKVDDRSVQASFSLLSADSCHSPARFVFSNQTNPNGNAFTWNVDGISTHTTSRESHQVMIETDIDGKVVEVIFIAENHPYGCVDTLTQKFIIPKQFTFYIPNAFTPDGDQLNDVFKAETDDIRKMELLIYNRWGQLIYQGEGNNAAAIYWDGMHKNEPAQQGTYTYVFNVFPENTCAGEELNFIGNVTLLK